MYRSAKPTTFSRKGFFVAAKGFSSSACITNALTITHRKAEAVEEG
jgi:hypothetical protein